MELKGKKLEGRFRREARIERKAINTENRTVELSFSSETPYQRWFGTEVLGHSSKEVRMDRLADGSHPLLLQHDDRQQIGVIEKAWIDGGDKRGRAIVRFSNSHNQLADTVFKDVVDGIRQQISVGYTVHHFRKEEELDSKGDPIPDKTIYRADDWEPMEISVVSIAADPSIGVGRAQEPPKEEPKEEKQAEPEPPKEEPKVEVKEVESAIEAPLILTRKKTYMGDKSKAEVEREELEVKLAAERAEKEAQELERKKELAKQQANSRIQEIYSIADRFNCATLRDEALKANWSVEKFRAEVMDRMNPDASLKFSDPTPESQEGKSIGQLFVESPQYRELGRKIQTRREIKMELPRMNFQRDNPFTAAGQSLTSIQKLAGVPGFLDQQMLNVSQIFPQATTSSTTIRYIKESSYTQAATAVAENGLKPTATLAVEEVDATVRKIAVLMKTTDEMLADYEGIRGYIDGRVSYMVQALEDSYLLNGSGSSNQITGIFNVSGINTLAASAYSTVPDAFGQAINKVRSVGFVEPDAIVCHPDDWTNLILTKDTNGQYYAGGPFSGTYGQGGYSNVGRMFGLPVVVTTFCTKGTALVGSFRIGAMIFRRQGITVEATNSNDDDFNYNRVTIRAEARMTLATFKPLAFCEITSIA